MPTLRPLSVLSASIALCAVATVASAQIRYPARPILLPTSSSSSSSMQSSALSSSVSSVKPLKSGLVVSQQSKLKNYCKGIAKLLKDAELITPTAEQQSKFDLSVDVIAKANALCKAMLD